MKPWYASKTIWLHLITLSAMVASYMIDNHLITDPDVLKSVIMAQAVLGMVLRVFTSQSIGTGDVNRSSNS